MASERMANLVRNFEKAVELSPSVSTQAAASHYPYYAQSHQSEESHQFTPHQRRETMQPFVQPPWERNRNQNHVSSPQTQLSANSTTHTDPTSLLGGRYKLGQLLGQGGFGAVYAATDLLHSNQNLVVKTVQVNAKNTKFGLDAGLVAEVAMQQSLQHPNVVPVLDTVVKDKQFHIIMPRATMDLFEYLNVTTFSSGEEDAFMTWDEAQQRKQHMTQLQSDVPVGEFYYRPRHTRNAVSERTGIVLDILHGLQYMHSQGVLHLDLKTENVLLFVDQITGRIEAKLADFGLSNWRDTPASLGMMKGTFGYIAPELIDYSTHHDTIGREVDYYAFAMVIADIFAIHPYQIATGWVATSTAYCMYLTQLYPSTERYNKPGNETIISQAREQAFLERDASRLPSRPPTIAETMLSVTKDDKGSSVVWKSGAQWLERVLCSTPVFKQVRRIHLGLSWTIVDIWRSMTLFDAQARRMKLGNWEGWESRLRQVANATHYQSRQQAVSLPASFSASHIYLENLMRYIRVERALDTGSIMESAFEYVHHSGIMEQCITPESDETLKFVHGACMLLALKKHKEFLLVERLLNAYGDKSANVLAAEQWLASTRLHFHF